jgi:epoxyqueuosine reductase
MAGRDLGCEVKVFVDTAAVMEKPLAQAAGLGWQGKHTNLVSREFGSWLFPRRDFTHARSAARRGRYRSLRLMPGLPRHLPDVGVSRALQARCKALHFLSHHRKQGTYPARISQGHRQPHLCCDDCLAVCPWNKFAQAGREAKLAAREDLRAPSLAELARLDDAAFRTRFTKSSVKRIGRDRFVRNVLIAIGNSGDGTLAREARRLVTDASPLVPRRRGVGAIAVARTSRVFGACGEGVDRRNR